jgi:hypothetical protein
VATDPVNDAVARLRAMAAVLRNHGCTIPAVCAACDIRTVLDALKEERRLNQILETVITDAHSTLDYEHPEGPDGMSADLTDRIIHMGAYCRRKLDEARRG